MIRTRAKQGLNGLKGFIP